jgi:phosphoglycerate dehydrogenase-like enzyme
MPTAIYVDMADTDTSVGDRLLSDAGFSVRYLPTRDRDEIIAECQDAEALLVGYAAIDGPLLDALPKCQIVSLLAAGVDNVDVAAASERGVWVANVPGVATDDVATHALALTLSMLRQLPQYQAFAISDWNARGDIAPPKLGQLTLGLVGLGQIGRRFADLATGLFGSVIGYDPAVSPGGDSGVAGLEALSLERVLSESDVVSLHVPLMVQTSNMVDEAFLASMKPGSYLVNVSRGGLVDSEALARALSTGHLRHAALDTIDEEPPSAHHPLVNNPRVTLTPHVAYFSSFTDTEYPRVQAQNVVSWALTGRPDHSVGQPVAGERVSP